MYIATWEYLILWLKNAAYSSIISLWLRFFQTILQWLQYIVDCMATVRATVAVVLQLLTEHECALIIYILIYMSRGLLKSKCLQDLLAVWKGKSNKTRLQGWRDVQLVVGSVSFPHNLNDVLCWHFSPWIWKFSLTNLMIYTNKDTVRIYIYIVERTTK